MAGSARLLLAAPTSSGDNDSAGNNSHPSPAPPRPHGGASGSRPKRTLIESACSACRRRKSRVRIPRRVCACWRDCILIPNPCGQCDGVRPTCSRCHNLRTDCHYEAEEGESRWSALRRRNQILEAERDQLRELMAFVQNRPEADAQDIFQRIRNSNYDDLFMLLRAVQDGVTNMQPPSATMAAIGRSVPTLPTTTSPADQRLPPIHAILDPPRRASPPAHLLHSHSISSEESAGSLTSEMATNISTPVPGAVPPPHRPLNTLEPSLHQHPPSYMRNTPATLSSEESTSSVVSTSLDVKPFPPSQDRSVAGPDPPHEAQERLPYYVNGQHAQQPPGQHGLGPYYN